MYERRETNNRRYEKEKTKITVDHLLHLRYNKILHCRSMNKKKNVDNGKLHYMRSHLRHLTKLRFFVTVIY